MPAFVLLDTEVSRINYDGLLGHADPGKHFSLFQLMLHSNNSITFGASNEKKKPPQTKQHSKRYFLLLERKRKAENILFQNRKSSGRWYPQDRLRIVQQQVQMNFFSLWSAQLPFPGTETISLPQRSQEWSAAGRTGAWGKDVKEEDSLERMKPQVMHTAWRFICGISYRFRADSHI